MKLSVALFLASACTTSAFMTPGSQARFSMAASVLSEPEMAVEPEAAASAPAVVVEEEKTPEPVMESPEKTMELEPAAPAAPAVDPRDQIMPGRYDSIDYSLTLPFLERPTALDGSHAGDYGFDPMGFTEDYDIYYMQECELRHARLAMLAVVGWPTSELVGPSWMLQDGRAPSVLNGVNPITFVSIVGALAAFGFFEYTTSLRRTTGTKLGDIHANDMAQVWKYGVAGDYNFDPQGLYSKLGNDAAGRKAIREVEVTQGRYAMLAITYFAAWEALTGSPIVANNPFFHPNAVLPLAAVGYFTWSQFYQVSDVRKFPIKIEYTKDGEEMLRGVNRGVESVIADSAGSIKLAKGLSTGAVKKLKQLQESV